MLDALKKNLLYFFIFLLPWQTVYIVQEVFVAGEKWQYVTVGIYLSDLILVALIVLHGREIVHHLRKNFKPLSQSLLPYLFITFLFFSALTAPDMFRGVSVVLHIIGAMLLFTLAKNTGDIKKILIPFVISMTLVSLLAITQFFLQTSWDSSALGLSALDPSNGGVSVIENNSGRWLRAYGSLPHPNILGGFLTVGILATFYLLFHAKRKLQRVIIFTSTLVMSAALFFSFSRSAWLATAIGLLFLLGWVFAKRRTCFSKILIVYACLGLFLITIAMPYKELLVTRSTPTTRLEAKSLTDRSQYISEARTLIKKHPLVGVGIGNYTHALREEFPGRKIWTYQPVHNVFFLIAAELGFIGVTFFMSMLFFALKNFFKKNKTLVDVAAFSTLISLSLISLLDHWLWTLPSGLYLVTIVLALVFHDTLRLSGSAKNHTN